MSKFLSQPFELQACVCRRRKVPTSVSRGDVPLREGISSPRLLYFVCMCAQAIRKGVPVLPVAFSLGGCPAGGRSRHGRARRRRQGGSCALRCRPRGLEVRRSLDPLSLASASHVGSICHLRRRDDANVTSHIQQMVNKRKKKIFSKDK